MKEKGIPKGTLHTVRHWCGFVIGIALLILHKVTFYLYGLGGMRAVLFALCVIVEFCFYMELRFSKVFFAILTVLYGILAIVFWVYQVAFFMRGFVDSFTVPGIVTIVTFNGKTVIGIVDLVRSIRQRAGNQ